jgi:TfoX/Sxy family transcriptional regulator of competence genes
VAEPGTWEKASPELIDRFHAALPDHPAAERRKMFGYPACFVNGNFFTGLHQQDVVVRLPGDLRSRFAELGDADGFDPRGMGRPMKDWYRIPPSVVQDPDRFATLLAGTFEEVLQLPPKEKAPKRPRA